ncbi:MAG: hypothetical protein AABZ84_02060 [Pseudomonadota bacterium]
MRRAIKFALTMGSAALIVSGAATAGPPIAYDQWQAVDGQIVAPGATPGAVPCAAGYTCVIGVSALGFLQRTVTATDGTQYFQTIITDEGATGTPGALPFSDESFVRSGSTVGGIAGKQRVTDLGVTNPGQNLTTLNELNMGWAQSVGATANQLDLSQTLTENAVGFSTGFRYFRVPGDENAPQGLEVNQSVLLPAPGAVGTTTDKQVFTLRQLEASAAGSATLPTGPNMTWVAGDQIKAIWVGQNMPSTGQVFGFQSHINVDTDVTRSYFSLADTGPWTWAPVFGTAPTF